MSQVYLNGQFVPPGQAKVSVFDRGFIFGDGVYEVIPVFGGRMFRLPHHLSRLEASLAAIRLRNPHSTKEWKSILSQLLDGHANADQSIYLQITRGVAPRDHAFPTNVTPTVFAYAQPLNYSPAAQLVEGVAAVTAEDIRWQRCDIKAIALLANALLRQQAIEQQAAEAILIREGVVTEGAASNIFFVKDDRLVTPPKGPFILPGITRDLVVEIARANGIICDEQPIKTEMLRSADELWLTSSTKEILPITRLDGKPVGRGKPGAMHAKLFALYKEYKQAFIRGEVD
ncbi:MAG: D-amino-acid transaminase [Gammaproteobacteria bacterium]|nr:D-amino-acid transaminase [Gammaproteobacteria bacterium]